MRTAPLPRLPNADPRGNFPAVEYARVSIARDIRSARVRAGLSPSELAGRAGIRLETLARLEMGKHSARLQTLLSIERALESGSKQPRSRGRGA
jgi:predicted transcriptional regulator